VQNVSGKTAQGGDKKYDESDYRKAFVALGHFLKICGIGPFQCGGSIFYVTDFPMTQRTNRFCIQEFNSAIITIRHIQ
ncbi:MAG: hypothetical protein ACOX7O_10010, partial [Oscillospiraceae bacterium]